MRERDDQIATFIRRLTEMIDETFPESHQPAILHVEGLDEEGIAAVSRVLDRPLQPIAGIPDRRVSGRAGGVYVFAARGR